MPIFNTRETLPFSNFRQNTLLEFTNLIERHYWSKRRKGYQTHLRHDDNGYLGKCMSTLSKKWSSLCMETLSTEWSSLWELLFWYLANVSHRLELFQNKLNPVTRNVIIIVGKNKPCRLLRSTTSSFSIKWKTIN